jgi:hypothetical protein
MTQRASDSRTATAFYSIANKPHARQTSKTRARRTTKEKHAYIIPFLLRESTRQKGTKQGWRSRWQGRRCSSAAGNQPQNPNLVEVLSVQEVLEGSDYHANGWCFPCPRCKSSSFCTIIDPFFSGIRMSTVECGHREGWRQVALVWHIVAQLLALRKGQGLPCLTGWGIKTDSSQGCTIHILSRTQEEHVTYSLWCWKSKEPLEIWPAEKECKQSRESEASFPQAEGEFFFPSSQPEAEAHEEEAELRDHHHGLHEPQQVVRRALEQRRQHVPARLPPPQRRRERGRQELPPRRRLRRRRRRRRRRLTAAAVVTAPCSGRGRLPPRRHPLPHPLPHLALDPAARARHHNAKRSGRVSRTQAAAKCHLNTYVRCLCVCLCLQLSQN